PDRLSPGRRRMRADGPASARRCHPSETRDRARVMARSQSVSVLVVEDEALLLFAIGDDLRDLGCTVYEASNADQAIRRLEQHPDIAILFTDIDMPGSMDGLRLSAAVRDRWPPVKIIVTSGKSRPL